MNNAGLTHKDRFLKELNAEYFKIDERTLVDFIEFASKLAQSISYYNSDNFFDGSAEALFGTDTTILLIYISAYDIKVHEKQLDIIIERMLEEGQNFNQILDMLSNILHEINHWYKITADMPDFNLEIASIIKSKFALNLKRLIVFENTLIQNQLATPNTHRFSHQFDTIWECSAKERYRFQGEADDTRIKEGINHIYGLFNSIISAIELIIKNSTQYLEKTLTEGYTQPHVALFIAFIRLYKLAQNDINKFTQRHLDFFYKETLKFYNFEEIPDKVHLTFELQDSSTAYKLPKNTELYAGQDTNGKDIIYELDNELVVTKAKLNDVKTVINDNFGRSHTKSELFEHVYLDSNINLDLHEEIKQNDSYRLGFALAASFLKLSEGDRQITFTFHLQRYAFDKFIELYETQIEKNIGINIYDIDEFVRDLFTFGYSSEAENGNPEIFVIPERYVQTKFQKNIFGQVINQLDVTIKLPAVFPPATIVAEPGFEEAAEKELPVCFFYLHHDKITFYNFYKTLIIEKVGLKLHVEGIKDLIIQNDYGTLDASIPFEPFGATPVIGSTFYIGHENIFSQKIDDLQIILDWKDVPLLDNGFAEYYNGYEHIINNQTFKVKISALKDRKWIPQDNKQVVHLFDDVKDLDDTEIMPIDNIRVIDDLDLSKINLPFKGAPKVNKNEAYSRISTNGFLKMEFVHPPNGFGFNEYPEIIKKQALQSIKKKSAIEDTINPPWIPTLNGITLNYESSILIDFQKQDRHNRSFFYHILPFGTKLVSEPVGREISILPVYEEGAQVYLAINNFNTNELLSVFIHIDNLVSSSKEKTEIQWRFLQNDEWVPIFQKSILEDSTNDLTNSGIITFDFGEYDKDFFTPKNLTNNRMLPKGYFYLSFITNSGEGFINKIDYIKTNAASATFINKNNTTEHLESNMPANTIVSFIQEHPDIKEIQQPFASFGGMPHEKRDDFQTRVSERLRHKNRAVTIWDFEHLVLQEFPDVSKVVCLNHTNEHVKHHPGHVLMVVIPVINATENQRVLEPRSSEIQLQKIHDFLISRISPFTKLKIRNPIYEHVQVKFEIKLNNGFNPRYYLHQANEDLKDFLNPWKPKDTTVVVSSTDNVYSMHVVYFLEKLPYVDYVTNMSVFHIINGNIINLESASDNNAVLRPTTDISILVSANEHVISIIGDESVQDSIGTLAIGKDFSAEDITEEIYSDGIEINEIEVDFEVEGDEITRKADEDYMVSIDF